MGKEKAHMSMMIIGHVGSGKTTVADRLVYMRGYIDNIEKEATHVRPLLAVLIL